MHDFEFVTRHRVLTDEQERYLFEIDEYRRGEDQLLVAHFRFFMFSPAILKQVLAQWAIFRMCVKAPLVCFAGEDASEAWVRFVTMFGFRPMHQSILCNNGERRELYLHTVKHDGIDRHKSSAEHRSED